MSYSTAEMSPTGVEVGGFDPLGGGQIEESVVSGILMGARSSYCHWNSVCDN